MRLPSPLLPCITALLALATTSAAQSTVILPRSAQNPTPTHGTYYPWGLTGAPYEGLRTQTTYGGSELTQQGVQTPILIDTIRWRPHLYAPAVNGGQFHVARLELSRSPVGWNAMVQDFAANHGVDRRLVYDAAVDGAIVYSPTPGPVGWQPDSWCVEVPLRQPFFYDPTQFDLVVDVAYPTSGFQGGVLERVDGDAGSVGNLIATNTYPEGGTFATGSGAVIELGYTAVTTSHPVFAADVTRGATPLRVQFQDLSYSSTPTGVTSWAWDFDTDGTIDSTQQNPTHTYTACGRFDVTLTVDDGINPPVTTTEPGLIVTDEISLDLAATPVASRVLQFTAGATPTATNWAWDLDGDSIVDSTLRNPTFAYPSLDPVTVTLTASRLCGPSVTATREFVPAASLRHAGPMHYFGLPGWTTLFDLEVRNPTGINLVALDMPQFTTPTAPFAIEFWLTATGHTNKADDPTVWQRIGTAIGHANTEFAMFRAPVHVPNGVYGVALHSTTIGPTAAHAPAPVVVQNADLIATFGGFRATSRGQPFGPGTDLPLRAWNGAIHYEPNQVTERASHGFLGEGCAGSQPRATLRPVQPPELGSTARVDIDRLPDDAVLMIVGFDNRNSALGPLPLDLAPFGLSGCELRVRPDAAIALVGSSGRATWRLPIPNDPSLLQVRMFQQGVVFDSAHNPVGAVLSDAGGLVLGR